jgi:hypothetical protein
MKTNTFITKARKKHGDMYDYSLVKDKSIKNKQQIVCKVHGVFEQRGDAHLQGQGCPICGGSIKKTLDDFIMLANKTHNNKYNYSIVNYINIKTKIKIICPEHGEFTQIPDNHLKGHGCPKCAFETNGLKMRDVSANEFKNKAIEVHGVKYNYSNIEYINSKTPVSIICPTHGSFNQTPNDHLNGKGCLFCSLIETQPEREIKKFLNDKHIKYIENDRTTLNGLELDILIPQKNIAIEFNGLYWHSNKFKKRDYHQIKTELCDEKNIQLIHIFEDEWNLW